MEEENKNQNSNLNDAEPQKQNPVVPPIAPQETQAEPPVVGVPKYNTEEKRPVNLIREEKPTASLLNKRTGVDKESLEVVQEKFAGLPHSEEKIAEKEVAPSPVKPPVILNEQGVEEKPKVNEQKESPITSLEEPQTSKEVPIEITPPVEEITVKPKEIPLKDIPPIPPPKLKTTKAPIILSEKGVEEKPIPNIPTENKLESSIRTYANDIASLVKKGVTLSDVAISEQKRKFSSEKKPKLVIEEAKRINGNRKIILVTLGFIILGLAILLGLFFIGREQQKPIITIEIPSIIFANEQEELSITNLDRVEIFKAISLKRGETQIPLGAIMNLYITETRDGQKILLNTGDFLEKIETNSLGSFRRALGERFMLGLHSFDGNQGFLIFEIKSFENALPGILDWEDFMLDDLWPMFYDLKPELAIDASTGTSTNILEKSFEDKVIKNRDTRVLKNKEGGTALIYSFPDRDHLIIGTEESTMIEAFDRLTTGRFRN